MVNMIYNGPARRPRVRTTPTQREILQQARFDQNIRDGQRLGAIPEAPTPLARPTNPTNDDITNPPDGANHQMPFEDNLQDPAWLDDDPIVAHASYHRMRRYAERREIISTQWTQLETQVTSAYLQCQRDTSNWTYQPQGLPAELCTCSSDDIHERQVDLIDILLRSSTSELSKLHAKENRFTPGQNYTNKFFEEQWRMEQEYHCRTNLTVNKQKLELGNLLCLEEALDTAWRNVVLTPEQALARATACATLTRKIADLRALVGDKLLTAVSGIETVEEQELLMKIWYNKTELRQNFLALLQEKQPLVRVRHGGTRGQQKLMALLRKHAEQLHTVLDVYTKQVHRYVAAYPARPAPPIIGTESVTWLA
ncbi:hypothetical protein PtA15_14A179 [Puccinia triticina]|uniref:Uncharacterized protein n=1 Tax=Puccinia triticina TaxID=208348 RepID=A0ABY7D3P7_9BASI|nr:uncharacterized protein PtA15_14A179 [Puccinia triticina]WAQ91297.1 hypothetical protein PtA15_14A179 [Puccinia triticina]